MFRRSTRLSIDARDRPEARDGLPHLSTGHYVLERELGRGGMATVYLADDTKHQRKVAIKVLDATVAALLGADRFVREIRVTSQLQHPHVLALLDSGVFAPDAGALASRPFYVMPYWAPNGRRLFYRTGRELVAATIEDTAGFTIRARESLFRDTFAGDMPHANYAVLPDGQHFVMFGSSRDSGPEAVVVVNWLPELHAALASGARATAAARR